MLKPERNLEITFIDHQPHNADNKMDGQRDERFFQYFKAKFSWKLLLENFLGSETPEADSETKIHISMIE